MSNNRSNRPRQGDGSTPLRVKVIILAFLALFCIFTFLIIYMSMDQTADAANQENVSKAAARMSDTPLGKEDEAEGASWYRVSDNNKLITATFDQKDGYRWYCTISDEAAISLEEELNGAATWSATLLSTGDKDTESAVYFDCRKDGCSEPVCIYILKIRTDGSTLRVIGIEEQPEK